MLSDIVPLAEELIRLKKQAAALGLFTDDRELLDCTGCDLAGDVTVEGILMTYRRNSGDFKDSGLRFEEIDEGTFRCPVCGTMLKAVVL